MTYTGFRFTGRNAVAVRPADKPPVVAGETWARDRSSTDADDGTELDATWSNRIKANLQIAIAWLGGAGNTGDDQLKDALAGKFGAVDAALAEKAPLASPTFSGVPAAPTADGGTNTTQIATTAFVQAAVAALINSAPGVLDTLDELAAALGDDANFAATMTAALAEKAPLASPTLTGTPAAPTASGGTNTTQIATTAFVQAAIAAISAGVVSFNSRTGAVVPANDDYAVGNLAAIADATLVGNNTGGSARPLALTAAQARTLLGLVIGTDVQAYDADLAAIAAFAPTKGRLLVGDGSAWQVLGVGTNGHALVADSGEATGLKYAALGGMTELEASSGSSGVAAVEFAGTWSAYKTLVVVGSGISPSGSTANTLRVQISDDDGATYETVNYVYHYDVVGTPTISGATNNTPAVIYDSGGFNAADNDITFRFTIYDANAAAVKKPVEFGGAGYDSGAFTHGFGSTNAAIGAINRIKISFDSGNIDLHEMILYGM